MGTETKELRRERLTGLRVENVKVIDALTIPIVDRVTAIGGDNGAGKSSALGSLTLAWSGGKIPPGTVKRGAEKATIVVETTNLIVTRTVTSKDGVEESTLKVRTRDGMAPAKQQSVLDALVGEGLGFDPLALGRASAKDRKAMVLRLVPVAEDLDALEGERRAKYEERTIVGRVLRDAEGALAQIPAVEGEPEAMVQPEPVAAPAEESVTSIAAELDAAQRAHGARDRAARDLAAAEQEHAALETKVRRLAAELEEATAAALAAVGVADARREALAVMPAPPSIAEIHERLRTVESVNAARRQEAREAEQRARAAADTENVARQERNRQRQERASKAQVVGGKQREYDALTTAIDALDARREKALREATFPLAGMAVGEDVTLGGIPFPQLSTSEQIRVGFALAMADEPAFRVAIIRDGSLLDAKAREDVHRIAEEHDAQVLMELVGESDEGAWILREGGVLRPPVGQAVA